MANQIPEKVINFEVYLDSVTLLGMADVQLPDIESMTETVKGAGIAGEIETPTLGHFGSMTATLNFRTVTTDVVKMSAQKVHHIDVRGAIQVLDAGAGTYRAVPCKVVMRGITKKTGLGKLEPGAAMDTSTEMEVVYMKITLDGVDRIELDKFNFVHVVDGVDYMSSIRTALGRA